MTNESPADALPLSEEQLSQTVSEPIPDQPSRLPSRLVNVVTSGLLLTGTIMLGAESHNNLYLGIGVGTVALHAAYMERNY